MLRHLVRDIKVWRWSSLAGGGHCQAWVSRVLEEHGPEENSTEDGDLAPFAGSGKEEELTVGEWLKRPGQHRETEFAEATDSHATELTSGRRSICTQSPHTRA